MHRTPSCPENNKRGCGWTHAAPSLIYHEAENKSQMPYHYSRTSGENLSVKFEFFRLRFHFRALTAVHFPAGKSGNVIRGALGRILRDTATPAAYARLFEPGRELGDVPSGLGDWPRPFILRADPLDGRIFPERSQFSFETHVFDLRAPVLDYFREAFGRFGSQGIGPGRGRVELEDVEQVDLEDRAGPCGTAPLAVDLEPRQERLERVRLAFVSPTELKSAGAIVPKPEFPILFARLRDRLSTLRSLYGPGPLEIDFRALGERAAAVRMISCQVQWERSERRSGRTGQTHPLGGFTGSAEYEGDLAEFLPWLRAARWVGVGRHTVWGKGDVRVV